MVDNGNSQFSLRPITSEVTDRLESRLKDWLKLMKQLKVYFKDKVEVNESLSKKLAKLSSSVIVEPNQLETGFLKEGEGLYKHIQLLTQSDLQSSNYYASEREFIVDSVLTELKIIKKDLSAALNDFNKEYNKLNLNFAKSRETTLNQYGKLVSSLNRLEGLNEASASEDPYLLNVQFNHQLKTDFDMELEYNLKLQNCIHNFYTFELAVVRRLKDLNTSYYGWRKRNSTFIQNQADQVEQANLTQYDGVEWVAFTSKFDNPAYKVHTEKSELNELTVRDWRNFEYPQKNHKLVEIKYQAAIKRQGELLKTWKQNFITITNSGYLYASKDKISFEGLNHETKIYLPNCYHQVNGLQVYLINKNSSMFNSSGKKHKLKFDTETEKNAFLDNINSFVDISSTDSNPPNYSNDSAPSSTSTTFNEKVAKPSHKSILDQPDSNNECSSSKVVDTDVEVKDVKEDLNIN